MKNKWYVAIVLSVLVMVVCMNAYAGDGQCALSNFFSSVGGFFYNALPWNWGNWAGK